MACVRDFSNNPCRTDTIDLFSYPVFSYKGTERCQGGRPRRDRNLSVTWCLRMKSAFKKKSPFCMFFDLLILKFENRPNNSTLKSMTKKAILKFYVLKHSIPAAQSHANPQTEPDAECVIQHDTDDRRCFPANYLLSGFEQSRTTGIAHYA